MDTENQEKDFFGHPEVKELLSGVFGNIEHESDRGAVLVAQEIISNELVKLFSAVAPGGMPTKKVKELLRYPGLLATFSAKTEIAYIAGFIGKNVYDAIHTIRSIRNDAAHASQSFSLEPYRQTLVDAYRNLGDFGETKMEDILRAMAIELYVYPLADSLAKKEVDFGEKKTLFKDRDEAMEHIQKDPETLKLLLDKLAKVELGLAVVMLCGLIIVSREGVLKKREKKSATSER